MFGPSSVSAPSLVGKSFEKTRGRNEIVPRVNGIQVFHNETRFDGAGLGDCRLPRRLCSVPKLSARSTRGLAPPALGEPPLDEACDEACDEDAFAARTPKSEGR